LVKNLLINKVMTVGGLMDILSYYDEDVLVYVTSADPECKNCIEVANDINSLDEGGIIIS